MVGVTSNWLPRLTIPPRQRIIVVIIAVFFAHTVEVWLHAIAYYLLTAQRVFVRPTRAIGEFVGRSFDPEVVDGLVNGASRITGVTAAGLRTLQTGYLRNYALAILGGTLLVLLFVLVEMGR